MQKLKTIICLAAGLLGVLSANISSAGPDLGTGSGSLTEGIAKEGGYGTNVNEYTLSQTIGRVIKVLLSFVGTIFFALAVYAGFLWMTAQGNEEKVAQATGIIRTAVIGMIIVLAAYSITAFALIFTAQSTSLGPNV